jgi:hypothetical protein
VRQFSGYIGIGTLGIVEEARGDKLDAIYVHQTLLMSKTPERLKGKNLGCPLECCLPREIGCPHKVSLLQSGGSF